jgi:hypothetical protein
MFALAVFTIAAIAGFLRCNANPQGWALRPCGSGHTHLVRPGQPDRRW